MSDVLIQTLLRKGETAAKVLAGEGWPKNTHQKLIDARYNKEFKKTAKDSTTKLPNAAPLSWPTANPATYKILKTDIAKLLKELMRLDKIRTELEIDIGMIEKIKDASLDGIFSRMDKWGDKYLKYKGDQEKLYDQCVKTASACKDVKFGMKISKKKMQEASKQMDKLDKELRKHNNSGGLSKNLRKEIAGLRKRLKPLKAEQDALMKELVDATKLVVKLAIVMP